MASTRTELNSTKSAVTDLATELNGKLELKNFNLLTNWKNLNLTARTSELVDIGQMPTSCADLERMGQKVNGFFSVKGAKKMEMIYCNFFANQNGRNNFTFTCYCSYKSFFVYRQTKSYFWLMKRFSEMDRIRRRQIDARPFLRPEKLFIWKRKNSDPVRVGAGERGKCHEFDIGEIHGPATGNLFFLLLRTCASLFFIFCLVLFSSFFEWECNRVE